MANLDKEVQWEVTLLGVDISDDVEDISSLTNSLDVPVLTEYTVNDCTLQLMPNRYDYSPDKASNFFTDNMHDKTGYRASVVVKGGFRGETLKTLFSGRVVELQHDVSGQGYRLVATDRSVDLRDDTITDFGIRKNNNLRAAAEQVTIRGAFNFAEPVSPVSEDSVSATLAGTPMNEVQNLEEEGLLSERDYQVSEDGTQIITETAPTNANAVVNATYKAPLRGVSIDRVIRELLNAYDINPITAELPPAKSVEPHWSYFARPNYELASATGTNNFLFGWNGYVTDFVRNTNGDMYLLYSHRGSSFQPELIKYTASTDSWESLHKAPSHYEWWQIATDNFTDFFIMQTSGTFQSGLPTLGMYNPGEAVTTDTSILKVSVGATVSTTQLSNTVTQRPQLSQHYWSGFIRGTGRSLRNNERFGFLPDNRTGFYVAENAIWYRFATRSPERFGLARARTSNLGDVEAVINIVTDEFNNEASFDFTLDVPNRTIYASHTTIGESSDTLRSRFMVYSRTMPTSF